MSAADTVKKVEIKVEADPKEKIDDKSDLVSTYMRSIFVKSFTFCMCYGGRCVHRY